MFFCLLTLLKIPFILRMVGNVPRTKSNQGSLRSPTLRGLSLVRCCFRVGPRNPSSNCAFSIHPPHASATKFSKKNLLLFATQGLTNRFLQGWHDICYRVRVRLNASQNEVKEFWKNPLHLLWHLLELSPSARFLSATSPNKSAIHPLPWHL